ncbi:DUF4760 domain-containing protein [Amycolatopsis magusensis]|uniref:DUF4760 domain-containing protein n=1 Tax=Amycolatopsis magusensis TaxID=882444 RepID=A0ABS4PWV3_9PSEU|nr:hypothetical protein [Amycolatopsis magusensis]MBP2183900.1 hypothetical protein [Amycolatopsis magusensis]
MSQLLHIDDRVLFDSAEHRVVALVGTRSAWWTAQNPKGPVMQIAALTISIIALLVSILAVRRQIQLSRHSNSIPLLVDLFREHRGEYLAQVRHLVVHDLSASALSNGLAGLPADQRRQVRDLVWFYDNLGAFVVHKIVDAQLVVGYLGGSVVDVWKKLLPLIEADRVSRKTAGRTDHEAWLEYFQYLYEAAESELARRSKGKLARTMLHRLRHCRRQQSASLTSWPKRPNDRITPTDDLDQV